MDERRYDHGGRYVQLRFKSQCGRPMFEISNLLAAEPGLLRQGTFQSQQQAEAVNSTINGGMPGDCSLFVPDPSLNWWPKEFGSPSATGSQNNVRYAYFANLRRLAVETNGSIWVYDTLNHQIGGFSQQQGMGGSILFSSQFGTVLLSNLPVISINGVLQTNSPTPASDKPTPMSTHRPATILVSLKTRPQNTGNEIDVIGAGAPWRIKRKKESFQRTNLPLRKGIACTPLAGFIAPVERATEVWVFVS